MSDLKPIDELSDDDLRRYPIWEYATDAEEEHDETYVRPVNADEVPADVDCNVYHVACDVRSATGALFAAFVSVCNGQCDGDAPIIVGSPGEYWPVDERPHRRVRERFDAFFGAPYEALFPLTWTLRALIRGETQPRTGSFAPP